MRRENRKIRIAAALLAALLAASALVGCGAKEGTDKNTESAKPPVNDPDAVFPGDEEGGEDDFVAFKPSDLGLVCEDIYKYPYMGMDVTLTEELLAKMESKDVIMLPNENYTTEGVMKYAFLEWCTLTEEQKEEEATAFDFDAWKASLNKVGTLGVFHKDSIAELDTITGCSEHIELGKSEDGTFTYYMSFAEGADEALRAEIEQAEVSTYEMEELDFHMGKTAFSEGRVDAANVGNFTAKDVNGEEYTEDIFADYDLTLVNVFTTWCSPCVNEMPELEELKQEMAAKGINVVTVVYDSVDVNGEVNEDAVEKANQLRERAGLTFPMLIPDETMMNGRLEGIDGYPESFLVDKDGNIVGETYVGARSFDGWKAVVEKELENLQ